MENMATRIESAHLDCEVVRIGVILLHYNRVYSIDIVDQFM
jgi:hypothetical protein